MLNLSTCNVQLDLEENGLIVIRIDNVIRYSFSLFENLNTTTFFEMHHEGMNLSFRRRDNIIEFFKDGSFIKPIADNIIPNELLYPKIVAKEEPRTSVSSIILKISGGITSASSIITNISTIFNTIKGVESQNTILYIKNFINSIGNYIPKIAYDINVSFAIAVYSCVVLIFTSKIFKWEIITTAVIPPIVVILWTTAYLNLSWYISLPLLIAANIWMGCFLLKIDCDAERKNASIPVLTIFFPINMFLTMFIFGLNSIWVIVGLCLSWFLEIAALSSSGWRAKLKAFYSIFPFLIFPANALMLIFGGVLTSIWAWIASIVYCIAQTLFINAIYNDMS